MGCLHPCAPLPAFHGLLLIWGPFPVLSLLQLVQVGNGGGRVAPEELG